MELKDLDYKAQLTCIALINVMVITDGASSPDEAQHAAHLAEAFGKDNYLTLVDKANEAIQTKPELEKVVDEITNQDVRELIFGEILECASEDGIFNGESSWLDWLAQKWDIHVEYEFVGEEDEEKPEEDEDN